MKRKLFVLANPTAGRKKVGKLLRELSDFLHTQEEELAFEIQETIPTRRGDQTVSELCDASFTDLVILGGDGTIHEAINGMQHSIPVSILPAGTGNDYVKNLSIGQTLDSRMQTVLKGSIKEVDLGVCNGRKFTNGVGIGFDGQIVADMQNRSTPLLSGQAKYYYHVLHILSNYRARTFDLTVDDIRASKDMILMTIAKGTTFGGGFQLTPHARVDDGDLAVCEIGPLPGWKRYANVLSLQSGSHDRLREVKLTKAKSIEIGENPLLEGHIDGEYLGQPPFSIEVLPKALQVRVATHS